MREPLAAAVLLGEGGLHMLAPGVSVIARAVTLSHFPDQAGPGNRVSLNAAVAVPYKPTAHWLSRET